MCKLSHIYMYLKNTRTPTSDVDQGREPSFIGLEPRPQALMTAGSASPGTGSAWSRKENTDRQTDKTEAT